MRESLGENMFKMRDVFVGGVAAAALLVAPSAATAGEPGIAPVKVEKIQKALEKSGVSKGKIAEVLADESLARQVAVAGAMESSESRIVFPYFADRAVNRARMCFNGGDPRRTNTYIAGNAWGQELYRFSLETYACVKYAGGGAMYPAQRTFFKTKSNTYFGGAWSVAWDGQTDSPQNCSGSGDSRTCYYWHARANVHASLAKIGQNVYPYVNTVYNSGSWALTRGD